MTGSYIRYSPLHIAAVPPELGSAELRVAALAALTAGAWFAYASWSVDSTGATPEVDDPVPIEVDSHDDSAGNIEHLGQLGGIEVLDCFCVFRQGFGKVVCDPGTDVDPLAHVAVVDKQQCRLLFDAPVLDRLNHSTAERGGVEGAEVAELDDRKRHRRSLAVDASREIAPPDLGRSSGMRGGEHHGRGGCYRQNLSDQRFGSNRQKPSRRLTGPPGPPALGALPHPLNRLAIALLHPEPTVTKQDPRADCRAQRNLGGEGALRAGRWPTADSALLCQVNVSSDTARPVS